MACITEQMAPDERQTLPPTAGLTLLPLTLVSPGAMEVGGTASTPVTLPSLHGTQAAQTYVPVAFSLSVTLSWGSSLRLGLGKRGAYASWQ